LRNERITYLLTYLLGTTDRCGLLYARYTSETRGVDPYGTGGTRPPNTLQYLDWGDIITNVPPQYF